MLFLNKSVDLCNATGSIKSFEIAVLYEFMRGRTDGDCAIILDLSMNLLEEQCNENKVHANRKATENIPYSNGEVCEYRVYYAKKYKADERRLFVNIVVVGVISLSVYTVRESFYLFDNLLECAVNKRKTYSCGNDNYQGYEEYYSRACDKEAQNRVGINEKLVTKVRSDVVDDLA